LIFVDFDDWVNEKERVFAILRFMVYGFVVVVVV
jgi:hypothetical protein